MTRSTRTTTFARAGTVGAAFALALLFGYGAGCADRSPERPGPSGEAGALVEDASVPVERDAAVQQVDGASACPPALVTPFVPAWAPPVGLYQDKCNQTQIEATMGCAFAYGVAGEEEYCETILAPENDECRQCLITAQGASVSGAIIADEGYGRLNVAGCLWGTTDKLYSFCIHAWAAQNDCAAAACVGCRSRSIAVHDGCVAEAVVGAPCRDASADCVAPLLRSDGGPISCQAEADFLINAVAYGELFCGPAPRPDAGDSGSGD